MIKPWYSLFFFHHSRGHSNLHFFFKWNFKKLWTKIKFAISLPCSRWRCLESTLSLRCAPFCRSRPFFRVRVSVTKGGWRGREKPNKQVSLSLHRMFNYRHQNRDDRWIINIAYITMKRRTNSQATFQYADSEHLWLFHTRVKYGLPLFHYWDNTTLREEQKHFSQPLFLD